MCCSIRSRTFRIISDSKIICSFAGQQEVSPANDREVGPRRALLDGAEPWVLQLQRPPPMAETGSCRWGRGQRDASECDAAAGYRNPSLFAEKAICWPSIRYSSLLSSASGVSAAEAASAASMAASCSAVTPGSALSVSGAVSSSPIMALS